MRRPAARTNSTGSTKVQSLQWDRLEDRRLLAVGISFDPESSSVIITGDGADDSALVVDLGGGSFQVQGTGAASQDFLYAFVVRVDFFGNGGNDRFENQSAVASRAYGHSGNDILIGGSGVDVMNGGLGNDQIYGSGGNDTLLGAEGDDWLYGGDGNDQLLGYSGNDWLFGGEGSDSLYGQASDDHVYGDAGNDRVRGNSGMDQLFGGSGNDFMMGDSEDDSMYGESGIDQLFGWTGVDRLDGGDGDDWLYGQEGNDELIGGIGNDLLRGGSQDDLLSGGNGADRIYGEAGVDLLRGGSGVDILRGGDGNDSLFGGELGDADTLYGEAGSDRFLTQSGDFAADATTADATLRFVNVTSNWNDLEIEVLDVAFARLCDQTGNTRLLHDSLDTRDLGFYKYSDLGGAAGINTLSTSGFQQFNPQTGQWEWVYTYEREIHILDWNENSTWYNDQFQLVVLHEIGHNWDSQLELATVSAQVGQLWDSFLGVSGWRSTNPYDNVNYTQSLNGQWWYSSSASFAENYGRTSPQEDLSTMWEYFFDPNADASQASVLQSKLDILNSFFSAMS